MAAKKPSTSGEGASGLIPSVVAAFALLKASRSIGSAPSAASGTAGDQPSFRSVPEPEGGAKRLLWRADRFQRDRAYLAFPIAVGKKFGNDKGAKLAALIAYFGFFSIFPLMMAFTSIIGYVVPDAEDQERLAEEAADQIPVVGGTIQDNVGSLEGSVPVVVIGLAVALWSGLRIVDAMQNAMNDVWDIPPYNRPNLARRRGRSFLMLFLLGGGIFGSVAASSVANVLDVIPGVGRFGIWVGSAAVSIVLFWLAYQLLTDAALPWKALVPGAVVGGLSWWALQTFGAPLIADQQANAGDTYGDFAAIIALLFFLFIAAQLSIIAAEINVVAHRGLWPRSIFPHDFTDADIETFQLAAGATRQDAQYEVALRPPTDDPSVG